VSSLRRPGAVTSPVRTAFRSVGKGNKETVRVVIKDAAGAPARGGTGVREKSVTMR